jgi:hypothetical protein
MATAFVPGVAAARSKWRFLVVTAIFVWGGVIAIGGLAFYRYEGAPGALANAPTVWPSASRIPRQPGLPTVLVFAHPHCPCTRATIGELALLMTRLRDRAAATVVFARPEDASETWAESDLWRSAAAIPGVTVVSDPENREADLFGALASGQTLLYDEQGHLQFNGGITAARGHAGDNIGLDSIIAMVTKQGPTQARTSVFGCVLRTPAATQSRGQLP